MRTLLNALKQQRTEDTLTECICYLIGRTSDEGVSFVREMFGLDAVQVYFQSQHGIKVNKKGQRIRPDIIFNIRLKDNSFKTIVVECKYGDGLDESKLSYFDYFSKYTNCELWLLCSEWEMTYQNERMAKFNLNFKTTTFEKIVDALNSVPSEDSAILSFIKEHTKHGDCLEREKEVLSLKLLENCPIEIKVPEAFRKDLIEAISNRARNRGPKLFYKFHNQQEDISPLEFEIYHNEMGRIYFSIPLLLSHSMFVTRIYESSEPIGIEMVAIRRKVAFGKPEIRVCAIWMATKTMGLLVEFFHKLYYFIREVSISAYMGREEGREDSYLVMALGSYATQSLELVFKEGIELRLRFRANELTSENRDRWCAILAQYSDVEKYDRIESLSGGKFEDKAIKIVCIRDSLMTFDIVREIISSWKKFPDDWSSVEKRFVSQR